MGQILSIEKQALNSFIGAFFPIRQTMFADDQDFSLIIAEPLSVQFVTPDLLENGIWKMVANISAKDPIEYLPLDAIRVNGYVGVKVVGAAIITKLLEAYFLLYPWNGFAKPDYLDSFLLRKDMKPKSVLLK